MPASRARHPPRLTVVALLALLQLLALARCSGCDYVKVEASPVECQQNLDCFIARARTCSLASVMHRTVSTDGGTAVPTVMRYEIAGKVGSRCHLRRTQLEPALHRTGMREAERYAERTVFIAGMLGVPTSGQDAALLVAVPVGGCIVVKLGGMALKRAAFALRRFRSADEVVERARHLGFQVHYATDPDELRRLAGDAAVDAVEKAPAHVGAASGRAGGKHNPWNPLGRNDNCSACVAAVIRNSLKGYFEHSADDLERLFEYAGRERGFNVEASLRYIERSTGLRRFPKPVPMLSERAPVGHYAVFTRWSDGTYHHVMYGRVTPTGHVVIFDPQTMEHLSYEAMLKKHGGKALPYLLEAP